MLDTILLIERRDSTHTLRTEAIPRSKGRRNVEGNAHTGDVVFADLVNVLEIGCPEESIDARPMRQATALKAAELSFVLDGVRRLESEFLNAAIIRRPLLLGQTRLATRRFHPLELSHIGEVTVVLPIVWSMGVKKGHRDFLKARWRKIKRETYVFQLRAFPRKPLLLDLGLL